MAARIAAIAGEAGNKTMEKLNQAERELVAIGAALGSNCVPCIEYHIPEARKAGLADSQIEEAIGLADKVRQVPARKVLAAARGRFPQPSRGTQVEQGAGERVRQDPETPAQEACCN